MANQFDADYWLHLVQDVCIPSLYALGLFPFTSVYLLASQLLGKVMLLVKVCSFLQLSSREIKLMRPEFKSLWKNFIFRSVIKKNRLAWGLFSEYFHIFCLQLNFVLWR